VRPSDGVERPRPLGMGSGRISDWLLIFVRVDLFACRRSSTGSLAGGASEGTGRPCATSRKTAPPNERSACVFSGWPAGCWLPLPRWRRPRRPPRWTLRAPSCTISERILPGSTGRATCWRRPARATKPPRAYPGDTVSCVVSLRRESRGDRGGAPRCLRSRARRGGAGHRPSPGRRGSSPLVCDQSRQLGQRQGALPLRADSPDHPP
jgi:hypothetical protein